MVNSRRKGADGERELANYIKTYFGYDLVRGQQSVGAAKGGRAGVADVIGLPKVHIEVKRVQTLNIEKAMAQSRSDALAEGKGDIPVVMHRRNREKWKVTLDLDDFMVIAKNWLDM